ncbi:hypothetical protein MLD38_028952 [Melastoma candidum]|uniref:Uncharacterized protein n=1 Tax=Melastoma candidum TaxID=119954 RepID=A0ACB9N4D2_9MYRT|nr:hypothetical protein MLD38_028952 [Melastoma candidum]
MHFQGEETFSCLAKLLQEPPRPTSTIPLLSLSLSLALSSQFAAPGWIRPPPFRRRSAAAAAEGRVSVSGTALDSGPIVADPYRDRFAVGCIGSCCS